MFIWLLLKSIFSDDSQIVQWRFLYGYVYEVARITVVIIVSDEHFTFLVELTGKLFDYCEVIRKLSCIFDLSRNCLCSLPL